MTRRNLFIALTILVCIAWINFGFIAQARRNSENKIPTAQQDESPNLISTETKKTNQISDLVAYELFFRTVGANNARGLVKRAGLGDKQIEKVFAEAKSLNESYESGDKFKRELRQSKSKLTSEKQSGFLRVKEQTETNLTRVVTRFLPQGLGAEDWQKFQDFIETEVKPNIQIIPVASLNKSNAKNDSKVKFIKTSSKKAAAQTGGNIYLYSAAWKDGANVFGSGTLTEDQTSYNSYLVTTTVTSSGGRSNTTTSDWNYATVANNSGLSIETEDGTYNVQATFEADAGGYYDEWGNYYSYGTYYIGAASSAVVVAPQVSIGTVVSPAPFDTGAIGDITFTVFSTRDSPRNISVIVQLNEMANLMGVLYTVARRQTVIIATPGTSIPGTFRVSARVDSPPGTVMSEVRIQSATANGVTVPVGMASRDVSFTVTRPATAGGGGGGGGGSCGSCGYAGLGCSGCASFSSYGGNGCPFAFFNQSGCCCIGSPIVIDIAGDGFVMTNGENGVLFDLVGDNSKDQTSWTTANSDDAWLVLDRNNNNTVDDGKEMFGNYCNQPDPPPDELRNGFAGLAEFDKAANGGNSDGKITRADSVFSKLRLWQDKNHNGISEPEELFRLPALDVVAIFLDYRESKRTDEYGNRFKFRAKVRDRRGARIGRWAWDVFTVPPRTN